LEQTRVEDAIVADIEMHPVQAQRSPQARRIVVQGIEIEYRAWLVGERVNVGTYFPTGR
jgi:hypothetical protein